MKLTIGDTVLTATLADNISAKALEEKLKDGPITIQMEDYARMEKVGNLPFRGGWLDVHGGALHGKPRVA